MTQARSHLIPIGASGTYHCVQRCVRRAFLCGIDHYTSQSFEHRKAWVEERIALIGESFSVAIYAYAVMSNHLHLVLHVDPAPPRTGRLTKWLNAGSACFRHATIQIKLALSNKTI